ncbi:ATP-binding protein [Paenibacillus daejeonensis]|uniref:ATP-binding protein n=1 Tax=Paenibacillus daejeonensis TaxID=135193 RepID=UPI00035F2FB4|nr:ATP-binding protein [Paenibacillus daejeonensis]
MMSVGEAMKEFVENMTNCPSDDVICPICDQVIPKLTIYPLGIPKVVQPACKCEVQKMEREVQESVELQRRNEIKRKFSISNLGERFDDCRFGTFKDRGGSDKPRRFAERYAENFPQDGGDSLLIWGESGNGKSHLAAAVCHVISAKGYVPVFQSVPELLERIRGTFRSKKNETEQEIMNALRDCDLLVLDDIGSEKVTDWVMDVMFRVIDGRYRQKKPTLFTTNFSPTGLLNQFLPDRPENCDEADKIKAKRLHDRILEASMIIENSASSYRLEVAKARAARYREAEAQ